MWKFILLGISAILAMIFKSRFTETFVLLGKTNSFFVMYLYLIKSNFASRLIGISILRCVFFITITIFEQSSMIFSRFRFITSEKRSPVKQLNKNRFRLSLNPSE